MGVIIKIPVLPHVKKIILGMHRTHEPIKAELTSTLGLQIYSLIHDKTRRSTIEMETFTEQLEVELCFDIRKRDHRQNRLVLINNFYREFFKHLMFNWMQAQYSAGIPAYESIKNFLNAYKIKEEEYSYETGYRAWLRYKNEEYARHYKKKVAILSQNSCDPVLMP